MIKDDHRRRIRRELTSAGISQHALHKNEVKYLPDIIHADEHIGAAVNGRADVGSVMLVATDKRVIFLDCKSFYTTTDELSYDVVSGINCHIQGLFANVILHTRVGEYNLRFVNVKQAKRFVGFLEEKRLENTDPRTNPGLGTQTNSDYCPPAILDKHEKLFIQTHFIGVLSTIDRTGNVHGAVVYYMFDDEKIYILTKSETEKARNILVHPMIAFTIFEEATYETLQSKGRATIVDDNEIRQRVFQHMTSIRNIDDQVTPPPVTKIVDGSYVVFEITLTDVTYIKYK